MSLQKDVALKCVPKEPQGETPTRHLWCVPKNARSPQPGPKPPQGSPPEERLAFSRLSQWSLELNGHLVTFLEQHLQGQGTGGPGTNDRGPALAEKGFPELSCDTLPCTPRSQGSSCRAPPDTPSSHPGEAWARHLHPLQPAHRSEHQRAFPTAVGNMLPILRWNHRILLPKYFPSHNHYGQFTRTVPHAQVLIRRDLGCQTSNL